MFSPRFEKCQGATEVVVARPCSMRILYVIVLLSRLYIS